MKKNITLNVGGMFCGHCEYKISSALNALNGVESASAYLSKSKVEIVFDPELISEEEIRQTITDLGYEIKPGRSYDGIYILIIAAALYIILRRCGVTELFRFFPEIETGVSVGMLFIIGLLTSVHCIAMCGGINLSQSVGAARSGGKILRSNLLYNLGRVISYTIIGGLAGLLGSAIGFKGTLRGIVCIIAGIFMVLMGLNMLGLFGSMGKLRVRLPKRLVSFFYGGKRGASSLCIGLLNGLMPCGPLQSMQLYALYAGSFLRGAAAMLSFSLGTVPLMLAFGAISGKLNKRFAEKLLLVSAALIVVLGLGMLNNGMSLSGTGYSTSVAENSSNAVQANGFQQVETVVDYGSYGDITVKKGVPVKWTLIVPEGKLNGCNSRLIIPAYGLEIKLNEGENLIEFTPEQTGVFTYSCWMGMIKNKISVVE